MSNLRWCSKCNQSYLLEEGHECPLNSVLSNRILPPINITTPMPPVKPPKPPINREALRAMITHLQKAQQQIAALTFAAQETAVALRDCCQALADLDQEGKL